MLRYVLALTFLFLHVVAEAVTATIIVESEAYCMYATGQLCVEIEGGVGPYTIAWSTGSTAGCIGPLAAGDYSVTVTDFNSELATDQVTLQSSEYPQVGGTWLPGCPEGGSPGGPGGPPYRLFDGTSIYNHGLEPFTVNGSAAQYFPIDANWGFLHFDVWANSGAQVQYSIVDGNGCASTLTTTVPQPPQWLQPQVLEVDGSCSGGANGRIRAFVPEEPSGWAAAFKLYGPGGHVEWSSPVGNVDQAGYGDREFLALGLPAGTYHLVQTVSWDHYSVVPELQQFWPPQYLEEQCPDTLASIVVPDLGYTCGTLNGTAFVDANENCVRNGGEPVMTSTVIEVQPGNFYTLINAQGQYSINLPYGDYTVNTVDPNFQEHCGVSTTPFSLSAVETVVTRNLADTSLTGLDMAVYAACGAARPGFQVTYSITLANLTGVLAGTGNFSLTYDPSLIYLNANPAPSIVSGNTLIWNTNSIGAFQHRSANVTFQVPPDINLLGTVLSSTVSGEVAAAEEDLLNNSLTHQVTVTGAYDPNDKLATTSTRASDARYFIGQDEWIDYTIRFQNTGTDTAFFVVITDTLPSNLDPSTFHPGSSSHTHTVSMSGHGTLKWIFPNIMLPDSNINEPLSHGFASFRIRPHLPLLPGAEITNIANIYFDFNPPVITEPSVLVAEYSTGVLERTNEQGQLHLLPNPATDHLRITSEGTILNILVIAADGREVLRVSPNTQSSLIDVSGLSAGPYVVLSTLYDGTLQRGRFIKQ